MKTELERYHFEVSYGAKWIDLNDRERFVVDGASTPSRTKTFRQTKASSQIVEGDILIHSVADMVAETVKVQARGYNQADLEDNIATVEALFEQFSYRIRVTKNDFREIWSCQMSTSIQVEQGQVMLHNGLAIITALVPRQPRMVTERADS